MTLPTKSNPVASGEEPVDSETLSPLWFAGIYDNHFQYQVNNDILTRQSVLGSISIFTMLHIFNKLYARVIAERQLRECYQSAERSER